MIIEPGLEEKAKELSKLHSGTVFDSIGCKFIEISKNKIVATFPLSKASSQAFGLMHGGIYLYIAESLSSLGGWLAIDFNTQICVGIEINANHLKPVAKSGEIITAIATPLKAGKSIQVWQVEFKDQNENLVSISRSTVMIKSK